MSSLVKSLLRQGMRSRIKVAGSVTIKRNLLTPSAEVPYKTSAEVIQALSQNVIGMMYMYNKYNELYFCFLFRGPSEL